MSILAFVLDTVFFFLVAAALLRAWLNAVRINMSQQPGPLLLALTDWLVQPLRKGFPRAWMRTRWDVASLMAACLLALVNAAVWVGLGWGVSTHGIGGVFVLALPVLALKILLKSGLQTLLYLTLGHAILSWVQPLAPAYGWLSRLLMPLLSPIRRWVPLVGGVDLSALVLVLLVQIVLMLLG